MTAMHFLQVDATRLPLADQSVDLVFGSPPYADARSYGIDAQRGCQEWIDWMLQVTAEAVRVSRGLVIWVCAGVTRKHCYWPGPEGLLYRWWTNGGMCWRPAYWHRVGIPGSGGKQWLRADIEYCLCFAGVRGAIPWADNTANGHPPKWAPGGAMSYRDADGNRKNDDDPWGKRGRGNNLGGRKTNGEKKAGTNAPRPPGPNRRANGVMKTTRRCARGKSGDDTMQETAYVPPALANPGVLIKGIKVGGGLLGHPLAHENEAPFPVALAKWFIRGWCPPDGTVLDPFVGSGTTVQAAMELGRNAIGCDIRASQIELSRRRCQDVQVDLFS